MPYSPLAIANFFILLASQQGKIIEHMKLQKLVYCSHGWWISQHAADGSSLVSESPQAWQYGPVYESLYHVLKSWGREDIPEPQFLHPLTTPPSIRQDDSKVHDFLRHVWERYQFKTSWAMSVLTHKEGTPWYEVSSRFGGADEIPPGIIIPDARIKEEFEQISKESSFG